MPEDLGHQIGQRSRSVAADGSQASQAKMASRRIAVVARWKPSISFAVFLGNGRSPINYRLLGHQREKVAFSLQLHSSPDYGFAGQVIRGLAGHCGRCEHHVYAGPIGPYYPRRGRQSRIADDKRPESKRAPCLFERRKPARIWPVARHRTRQESVDQLFGGGI